MSSRSHSQILNRDDGDADSDSNSNDNSPSPRLTRQAARDLARRRRGQQMDDSGVRRSTRLLRRSSSIAPVPGATTRNSSRDDPTNIQSRLRRSARVARLGRMKQTSGRCFRSNPSSRQAVVTGRMGAPTSAQASSAQVLGGRRSARLAQR